MTLPLQTSTDAPAGYCCLPGSRGVLVRTDALEGIAGVVGFIFDLDGVIIDSSASIGQAHPVALDFWAERFRGINGAQGLVNAGDVAEFRLAGGFNDDWNIAAATALFYSVKAAFDGLDASALKSSSPTLREAAKGSGQFGGGTGGMAGWLASRYPSAAFAEGSRLCDSELVKQIFMEAVAGPHCPEMYGFEREHYIGEPLIQADRLLIDTSLLYRVPQAAVYTGRTYGEAKVGLRLVGLEQWVPDELVMTCTNAAPKPDGRAIAVLSERMGGRPLAYIGDNIDDMNSVLLYRESGENTVYTVQVCPGDSQGTAAARFVQAGADLIAPDSNAALEAWLLIAGR